MNWILTSGLSYVAIWKKIVLKLINVGRNKSFNLFIFVPSLTPFLVGSDLTHTSQVYEYNYNLRE